MNVGLNARKQKLRNKSKGKLTYNQRRRHHRPPTMGQLQHCIHSLAAHQDVEVAPGKTQTITYALPCQVKHGKATKKANIVHKDASGRKWK